MAAAGAVYQNILNDPRKRRSSEAASFLSSRRSSSVKSLRHTTLNPCFNAWKQDREQHESLHSTRKNATVHKNTEVINILKLKDRLAVPFYIIEPDSTILYRWRILLLMTLIYTALFTPYEVAFYPVNGFFLVDCAINALFILDIVLGFFCSFYHQNKQMNKEHVTSLCRIAQHYTQTHLLLDLLSALPVAVVPLLAQDSEDLVYRYASLRLVRLLRLTSSFRLLRFGKVSKALEQEVHFSYAVRSLSKYVCLVLLVGHWVACFWGLVAHWSDSYEDSWVTDYCPTIQCDVNDLLDIGFELYTAALYFSIMTITSIGYGNIIPINMLEHWTCVAIMLFGASIWAYTIGNASSIIATMGYDTAEYNRILDILDSYIHAHNYPSAVRKELYQYFKAYKPLALRQISSEVIDHMSPQLQHMVARWHGRWIRRVRWTAALSKNMTTTLVTNMENHLYCNSENMPSQNTLCTIVSGVGSRVGKVLVKGSCWGEDLILSNLQLMQRTPVQALTFCEVMSIGRDELFELLEEFPDDLRTIRVWAGFIALQRAMRLMGYSAKQNYSIDNDLITKVMKLTSKNLTANELKSYSDLVEDIRRPSIVPQSEDNTLPPRHRLEPQHSGKRQLSSDSCNLMSFTEPMGRNTSGVSNGDGIFIEEIQKEMTTFKKSLWGMQELAEKNRITIEQIKEYLSSPFA